MKVEGERWALRRGDWKLITGNLHEKAELYDLASDPHERMNVIELHPDRVVEMQAQIDEWRRVSRSHTDAGGELSDEDRARLQALGYVE